MSRDWLLFLDDLIEAANKVDGFVRKREFAAFCRDEGIFDAVLMNLLVIGEAVKQLPPEAIAAMPGGGLVGRGRAAGHHRPPIFRDRSGARLGHRLQPRPAGRRRGPGAPGADGLVDQLRRLRLERR